MREKKFQLIRKVFHSKLAQKLFGYLPPRLGQEFGYSWSKSNRIKHIKYDNNYLGENKEHLVIFAKEFVKKKTDIDFLVFGHRHIALDLQITKNARVIILGDFLNQFSYGIFDGENFWLDYFEV